jgi:hypothetical protein
MLAGRLTVERAIKATAFEREVLAVAETHRPGGRYFMSSFRWTMD